MGNQSCLCIFYHNCKEWSKHSSWSCWILLVAWPGRDISRESNHLWILSWCHMDNISFESFWLVLWHRADILWWVFGYCPLSSYPGFLEPMLCTLGSCGNNNKDEDNSLKTLNNKRVYKILMLLCSFINPSQFSNWAEHAGCSCKKFTKVSNMFHTSSEVWFVFLFHGISTFMGH